MNRNTRMVIVLAVAVVTAGLASLGVYQAVRHMPVVKVDTPSLYVVVARKPLEMGLRLTKDHVKLIPWPAKSQVPTSFTKIEDVLDRGLVAAVLENEPVTEGKLAPKQAGAGLPPAIQPGMRAMSVKVNEVVGVAGFVVPGAKVDVLVVVRQDKDTMSRVVVSNVQVLTAGTRYDQNEARKDGKPIPTTVVTLMVVPADAEKIALAANEGQIMLALRNPLDTAVTQTPGVRTANLFASPAPPRPAAAAVARRVSSPAPVPPPVAAPPPPPPPPYKVETIKATKRAVETVQ